MESTHYTKPKRLILLLVVLATISSCSNHNALDPMVIKQPELKQYVDSLKSTQLIYRHCANCNLIGLDNNTLIGFTDRYPPKGHYDKKEINIGAFEFDTFTLLDNAKDERTNGHIYICYFSEAQKTMFQDFLPYYRNKIGHYKLTLQVQYINNIAIITTGIQA